MSWIDWLIVFVPMVIVVLVSLKAQKYVKGVSDFLAAGRVAGRYVLTVASGEAAMGLISLVAMFEAYYNSGFAYNFWSAIYIPLTIIILLTGYCYYRFRETRAFTLGQFLEMRYSRVFRIFAAILQSFSGVLNYAIFPAVGARFLIYFCELPLQVNILGMTFPTFGIIMAIFLSLAVIIVSLGGQITIMVTDCIQGILSYPLYAIVVVYILYRISWSDQMAPALLDRPKGMSMINPFDIEKLRSFNIFYIIVGMFGGILNRMSWSGTQGYNASALNAHEQKMGAVLGTWRSGFSVMMYVLLAVSAYTYLNHPSFKNEALVCRQKLSAKVLADVVPDDRTHSLVKRELHEYIENGVLSDELRAELTKPIAKDSKEVVRDTVSNVIASTDRGLARNFTTIFNQMRVPYALKQLFPIGITGVFCALCLFLLISTDTTYLHSWGSIIVQDIILPLRDKPFTPKQQLRLLRLIIAGVAAFGFLFSFYFAQIDFILMFFAITGAIWLGGAGPCIVGGLYWKRGTTAGAFASLISGSMIATGGIILQKLWAPYIYPWLLSSGNLPVVKRIIEGISHPFEPYILWRVGPDKFPVNSQEIYFIALVTGCFLYIVVSLLTCKKPFNMDRMLHRGAYRREGEEVVREKLTFRTSFKKLLGIDSQYTTGDKAIAISVFIWSVGWGFGSFAVLCIWNVISPWPDTWWIRWFLIQNIIVPGIVGAVSTVWFTVGGIIDLRRLFDRLSKQEVSVLDDGRVIGNVNADDVELVEKVEHVIIEEAHIKEKELKDELQKETGDD